MFDRLSESSTGSASCPYADIRAHLQSAGQLIGERDLQIAAITRARNVMLITHNTREFARVPGLAFEDWEAP